MPNTNELSNLEIIYRTDDFELDTPNRKTIPPATIWIERFRKNKYFALYQLACKAKEPWFSRSLEYAVTVAATCLSDLRKLSELELVREYADISPTAESVRALLRAVPFTAGAEHIEESWIKNMYLRMLEVYRSEIINYSGSVEMYFAEKNQDLRISDKLYCHLLEDKNSALPFTLFVTYTIVQNGYMVKHVPLAFALKNFAADDERRIKLERQLDKASKASELIKGITKSGRFLGEIQLTSHEAYDFLCDIPQLESAGIVCRIPDFWKQRSSAFGVSIEIGGNRPSYLNANTMICVSPSVTAYGEELTQEEIEALLGETEGLAQIKGKWVAVDHDKLRQLLDLCEEYGAEGLSLARLLCGGNKAASDEPEVQLTSKAWLQDIFDDLCNPERMIQAEIPGSFRAELRPYQKTGFAWLLQHYTIGSGACLCDDMGLGKTVQVIAFLEKLRTTTGGKVLLIVPASLLGNWQREIDRFAPKMPYCIIHGQAGSKYPRDAFLSITTYGTVIRRHALQKLKWDVVLLDEAQAIKNPSSRQTKIIKSLDSRMRIAMTGTPIENGLSDLWSIFDFVNCGLLGTASEFMGFARNSNEGGYSRLREMIQPYMLRRMKTDKSIISDLPEKTEIPVRIGLSRKQVALYQEAVTELEIDLESLKGAQRRGLILPAITKFKQICNHPDQYLGQAAFAQSESGKFQMLRQICENILANRERVVVFTQYREMTGPLNRFLTSLFKRPGIVIHGGVPAGERSELVARFQGNVYVPYAVISIKAGGVGLNLTAANHVVMFDHWYNPAVEAQATDRTYRIGQTKNVTVYNFICKNTIEEKIDEMLQAKKDLAHDVIDGCVETWINKLNNDELLGLFRLS
jgi:non-specific serine/threonine protein kinase